MDEEIISYIFCWHALSDACPKCQSLNGREWYDQDLFAPYLFDQVLGNVWDLNLDRSLAHPNCRCQLTVRVEFDWTKADWYKDIMEVRLL